MENASKALLIAASVLVGVMILSLAVYLIVSFGSSAAKVNERNANQQLMEFNSEYTVYEGRSDITIYNIVSTANAAHQNNLEYESSNMYETYYKITVYLDNVQIQDFSQDELDKKIQNAGYKQLYQCTEIGYHTGTTGRVSYIKFKTI